MKFRVSVFVSGLVLIAFGQAYLGAQTISIADTAGSEGGNATFTVSLSGSPSSEVKVEYQTNVEAGDTATQADFTPAIGVLTFAAGATGAALSQTFMVALIDDSLIEGAETFTVTIKELGTLPTGVSFADDTAIGTIAASDTASLSIADASGSEGGNATFTVTLSGSPSSEVKVEYQTSVEPGDTATQADFTAASGILTFAAGATGAALAQTFAVALTDDSVAEDVETFTATLKETTEGLPAGISISDGRASGVIAASDTASLTIGNATGSEGRNATFRVTLSSSPGSEVKVEYQTSVEPGDTATQADFTAARGILTFAAGATGAALTQTFAVALTDDSLAEGAETFTVTLSEPTGGLPPRISISGATGRGTINRSDSATLSIRDAAGSEGGNLTFSVTLSGSPGAEVTVDYATRVATASANDFEATSGTLTFAAGATGAGLEQTFTVRLREDSLAEGRETFIVTLSEPTAGFPNGISLRDRAARGTINASDPATLSISDAIGSEGSDLTFSVTLSGSPGAEVTVDYATRAVSASAEDFKATRGTLTFAARATGAALTQTLRVSLLRDSLNEDVETFIVALSEPRAGFPDGISFRIREARGTIAAAGSASLSVGDASGDEGGRVGFTVTLSASPRSAVEVEYATHIRADDTASTNDFRHARGTLTFAAGATGAALTSGFGVVLREDSLAEGAETFTVTLSETRAGFPDGISISDATGQGTINASDPAAFSISDATGSEGGNLTFVVSLSSSPGSDVTVDYATSIGTGDTASTNDFTPARGTLTFPAYATRKALEQTVTVTLTEDSLAEGAETFTVTLSEPRAGFPASISIGDATGQGTINASDPTTLSISDAAGPEGGDLTFTASLSGSPGEDVNVDYKTRIGSDDTASTNDFTSESGTLTFPAGATDGDLVKTISVATVVDSLVEGDETFTVTLSKPVTGFPPGSNLRDGRARGTIGAAGSASLSVVDASGDEGGNLTFTVSLSASPGSNVEVEYSTSIAAGDTATQADFTAASGTLTFAARAAGADLAQTFTVALNEDSLAEGAETFTVTLSEPAAGFPAGISISDATGEGTIRAGDAAMLSVSDAAGSEGGALTFTVTLSASPGSDVLVDYATSIAPGDTAGPADFESVSGTLTFAANATDDGLSQKIEVQTIADNLVEGVETFTVTLSEPAAGFPPAISIEGPQATGTIGAAGSASLSVSDADGPEGDLLTFTVTISASPGSDVLVDYATDIAPGDTAKQTDFAATSGTLTFAAGATGAGLVKMIDVATASDSLVEGDETFTVTLSATTEDFPTGIGLGDAVGKGTILGSGSAVLAISDASGSEGSDLTFAVTLSGSPGGKVTVAWEAGIAAGDTAETADFTNAAGTLTFASGASGGELRQTLTVAATDDELAEGDETFTVTLSESSAAPFPPRIEIGDGDGAGRIASSDAATMGISDAVGMEGSELIFAVALSGSPGEDVEVVYATELRAGDTASSDDFTAASGTLRFAAGATGAALTQTFSVAATVDSRAEFDETFTVTLSEPPGGLPGGIDFGDATAAGTITDNVFESGKARIARVSEAVAPRLAQAISASTVSAITGRIDAAARAGAASPGTTPLLGGQAFDDLSSPFGAPGSTWSYSDRMLGSVSFALPLDSPEGGNGGRGGAAFWGSGDYYRLSDADESTLEWSGDVLSFHVGADMRIRPDLLGGLSVSRTTGSIDYMDSTDEVAAGGRYDTRMTSVNPYVSWSRPDCCLGIWATVGYGSGEVEVDDDLAGRESSDMTMNTAAVGASGRLFSSGEMIQRGTTELKLKGEGSVALLDIEGRGLISPLTSDVQRLRLALEGSHARNLESGGVLTPSLELGVRHDSGDAVTGLGLEVGGALRYAAPALGLTVSGQGRMLVAHRDDEYEEWSIGGLVRIDPGADRHGLALTLTPVWGNGAAGLGGGIGRFYDEEPARARVPHARQTGRVDAEVGYGLSGLVARGVVTPFTGLVVAGEGARRYRVGSYLELAEWLRLSVEAGREERVGRPSDHGVLVRAQMRW